MKELSGLAEADAFEPTINDLFGLLLELPHGRSATQKLEFKRVLESVVGQLGLPLLETFNYALGQGLRRSSLPAMTYAHLFLSLMPFYEDNPVPHVTDKVDIALFAYWFDDLWQTPMKPICDVVSNGVLAYPLNEIGKYYNKFFELKEKIEELHTSKD